MPLTTALLPIFTLTRRHRATRDPEALAGLLELAGGPCPNVTADEARRYLREEAGWHVMFDEDDHWTIRPCRILAARHIEGSVLAFPRVRTGSAVEIQAALPLSKSL